MDERELVREVRHARDARGSSTTDRRDNAARARAGSFGRAAALSKCVHVGGKTTRPFGGLATQEITEVCNVNTRSSLNMYASSQTERIVRAKFLFEANL